MLCWPPRPDPVRSEHSLTMEFQQKHLPAELATLVPKVASCTPALAAQSTVAIVGACAPNLRQIGSATLLAVADARFVVTAAHVLVQAEENGMTIGISGGKDGLLTALPGTGTKLLGDVLIQAPEISASRHSASYHLLYEVHSTPIKEHIALSEIKRIFLTIQREI